MRECDYFFEDTITWENMYKNTFHFHYIHMIMVYNNALCASMQILEECNSLCLLPTF